MFDALYETLDRISRIEGRKYIILIGTGRDTFSKLTLDKILAKVKATPERHHLHHRHRRLPQRDVHRHGMGAGMRNLDYLQAQNQLKTFAAMTGGLSFSPIFPGELPDDFAADQQLHPQPVPPHLPPHQHRNDGTYRKVKVSLVDNEGHPLQMQDEKGKPLKYSVIARDGYNAKREVE